jgi:hypothetical protein
MSAESRRPKLDDAARLRLCWIWRLGQEEHKQQDLRILLLLPPGEGWDEGIDKEKCLIF